MAWEENSRICLHMQLIAILSRIGVILRNLKAFFASSEKTSTCSVGTPCKDKNSEPRANGNKQHALKGQKLLAQGNALGYHVRKLDAL